MAKREHLKGRAIDREWFRDRVAELRLSQRQLADALSLDAPALSRVLAGTQRLQIGDALSLAVLLEVSANELLRRMGFDVPTDSVPISGRITARAEVSPITPRAGEMVPVGDVPFGARALVFDCPETPAWHGVVVVYLPGPPGAVAPGARAGRVAVVEIASFLVPMLGTATFDGVETTFTRWGTTAPHPVGEIRTASDVLAIYLPSPPAVDAR